jgi:hypothetical protein
MPAGGNGAVMRHDLIIPVVSKYHGRRSLEIGATPSFEEVWSYVMHAPVSNGLPVLV